MLTKTHTTYTHIHIIYTYMCVCVCVCVWVCVLCVCVRVCVFVYIHHLLRGFALDKDVLGRSTVTFVRVSGPPRLVSACLRQYDTHAPKEE